MDIYLTKGDTGIGVRATLKYSDNSLNEHLKDADVRFIFGDFEIIPQRENDNKFLIVFESVHTKKARIYSAAFKVTYKDGRKETFPDAKQSRIMVKIMEG